MKDHAGSPCQYVGAIGLCASGRRPEKGLGGFPQIIPANPSGYALSTTEYHRPHFNGRPRLVIHPPGADSVYQNERIPFVLAPESAPSASESIGSIDRGWNDEKPRPALHSRNGMWNPIGNRPKQAQTGPTQNPKSTLTRPCRAPSTGRPDASGPLPSSPPACASGVPNRSRWS
jgi:hypothetical protein